MPLTREERFEATMHDLRRTLSGVMRYDAKAEQGGVFLNLTPTVTLHVECFMQHKRWRGQLQNVDEVIDEWLTKDRQVRDVVPPVRSALHRAVAFMLQVHCMKDVREDTLRRLYPGVPTISAELRLALVLESLVASWMNSARKSPGLLPLDELATMQVYFNAMPNHPEFGSFGSLQADTLDNCDNEFTSAWDECFTIAQRIALELGVAEPPSPPWPPLFSGG